MADDLVERLLVYADEINGRDGQITGTVEPEDILPLATLLREAAAALSRAERERDEAMAVIERVSASLAENDRKLDEILKGLSRDRDAESTDGQ